MSDYTNLTIRRERIAFILVIGNLGTRNLRTLLIVKHSLNREDSRDVICNPVLRDPVITHCDASLRNLV